MARQFCIQHACLLVLAWSTCIAASLTLDDLQNQLHQLRQENLENREAFVSEIAELKEKVIRLETAKLSQSILSKVSNNEIPRTCHEVRLLDPSLSSDMYWIDPDGQNVGDAPIYVYCDMRTGSTSILHDSESPTDVTHCSDPGCYSKSIAYSASMRQMIALAEWSDECHQSIKYDCNFAPFEVNGIPYSWWNDRDDNVQYFWSGNDNGIHTCQCGLENNCVDSIMSCNCDSLAPVQLTDDGVITEKNILPITRLNFGRTKFDTSSGMHTLGRFECTGQQAINEMPSSCVDLWRRGHKLNGLYSVMGTKQIESIHCDFSKTPTDPRYETWIGYENVHSVPTYFYVQRNTTFTAVNVPIPFEFERVNIGGAMNLTSGVFTAPTTGTYFFSSSGIANILKSGGSTRVALLLNGLTVGAGFAFSGDAYETYSLQSTLNLEVGDKVFLVLSNLNSATLYDEPIHFTHFTGWLLQEDIYQSLNMTSF